MADRPEPVIANRWDVLRRHTSARIALGRAGVSLPTAAHLAFQAAHAQARDAVHQALDHDGLVARLAAAGHAVAPARSAAPDRVAYLQRPDLGRRLNLGSRERLADLGAAQGETDVAFVIADGLSALAVERHALPLLEAIRRRLAEEGDWRVAPVVVVEQGRVAVGDDVGAALRAGMAVVLIGERPGLSAPDSLGVYLTFAPRPGRTDAERNCISNIHQGGLGYAAAAETLHYLLREARRRGLSGVMLKDDARDVVQGPVAEANVDVWGRSEPDGGGRDAT